MTIANDKVTVQEFWNVYKKNNNKDLQTVDKKSMEEYLDLYTIFRLKVKEAKELGIDTTKSFKDELAGYAQTLARPYLTEKGVIDSLVKEVYDRMQWDLHTSHIQISMVEHPSAEDTLDAYTRAVLIRDFINGKAPLAALKKYEAGVKAKISKNSSPEDTLAAFNKLSPLKEMFKLKTHDFASTARVVSEHAASKEKGGELGYLTGMMGMGYPYAYENAAYKAKQGVLYGPFRTPLGYHLMLVTDKRPYKEVHLSHLMLIFKKGMSHADSLKLKAKIDSVYGLINKGGNFEELAMAISEHKETAIKGGDIGWMAMGSNFPPEFKEAALAIKDNGQISRPVQTRFGWHIIKKTGERGQLPFDSLKADIKERIQNDERSEVSKKVMIKKIKAQYKFKEMPKCYTDFYAVVDSTLPAGQWKAEKAKNLVKPMFSLLDKTYTQQDFASYMEKNYGMVSGGSPKGMVDVLYKSFVEETCMETKESRLEQEYPEFKALMNEYRDGILLFNLTDQKVWSKAIKDTTGAKEYHAKNKDHFMWEERVDASVYTCVDEKTAEAVKKLIAKKKSDSDIAKELNNDTVVKFTVESKLFMKGDYSVLDDAAWTPGITATQKLKNKFVFANIRKIVPPTPKTYTEARGLVTSEYQTWLEKEWVESLKKKYAVVVDRKVFDSIQ